MKMILKNVKKIYKMKKEKKVEYGNLAEIEPFICGKFEEIN